MIHPMIDTLGYTMLHYKTAQVMLQTNIQDEGESKVRSTFRSYLEFSSLISAMVCKQ